MKDLIILEGITKDQLLQQIQTIIEVTFDAKIMQLIEGTKRHRSITYLTRKEAAALLRISLPTLNAFTKEGTLNAIKIGNRVLYSSDFIEAFAAQKLASIRKRRYKS